MLNDIIGTLFVVYILIVVVGGFEMILSFGFNKNNENYCAG